MITAHVFIATSLDGFIAREDGTLDWLLSRDTAGEDHGYDDFIRDLDGLVMGRATFDLAASFDPWPYDRPVVVLSRSLSSGDLPQHLVGRVRVMDLAPRAAMAMLADEGWQRVYLDGGRLVQSFLREGLVADMVVTRLPVLIGTGRPLFGPLAGDVALEHLWTRSFPSGMVQSKYRVLPGRPDGGGTDSPGS